MADSDTSRPEGSATGIPPAEGPDASAQILARLRTHGAARSRYLRRGEIGRGGMGMVLRVWDEDLRREMAMKLVLTGEGQGAETIPPKLMGRFLEEAQVTGQLDHPGIVPVHELGMDEAGAPFFTMRLVKGHDLKEVFDRVRSGDAEWTVTRALWVMLKVCDAMAYAHSKGVIHRDLKPANVMVGRFGEVYVMDWGIARVLGRPDRHDLRLRREDLSLSMVETERRSDVSHSADSRLFTMDGDVVGTPAYMAPEQARGEIERLGPRADVYSVGAMLYHLLSGEMPFVAPGAKVSQHMVLRWTLEGPPRPVGEVDTSVPEELIAICEKAMARDPEARYADMGELAADLRAYLEGRVVQAHRGGAWIELKKWVQRNRKLAWAWGAAAAFAGLGLAATLWVQVRGRKAAEDARALAVASETRANENLVEARRQEAIALRERSNVLRLSAFQELEDLTREADRLWPAVPARLDEMEAWLVRAQALTAGLDPSADGQDPGHRAQLRALREHREELSAAEREQRLASHPAAAALAAAERRFQALDRAAGVRAGSAVVEPFELGPEDLSGDPRSWNERALALVDPARTEFGRESEGLALARAALDRAEPWERHLFETTQAWGLFAVGLDSQALEAGRAALESSPASLRPAFETYLTDLARQVEFARGDGARAARQVARDELSVLEREVFGPSFADRDDRWWSDRLEVLVGAVEAFGDPRSGLVDGISFRHGWGVARRVRFAQTLEERTRTGAGAREAWEEARAVIRDPARCPAYGGLELTPQLGLLPLGLDPDSGLYEFADLATGVPPTRATNGRLSVAPESGAVFVLLPGGFATMGAQSVVPAGPDYDPDALADEGPVHEVRLAPFFLSKYELTQGQWLRFTGRNPSKHLSGTVVAGNELNDRSPVEQVTWIEAERQLARLGWSLPTEAQWEYAARAGVEAPWWSGDDVSTLEGVGNLSDRFARNHLAPWASFDDDLNDGHLVHAPVGLFEPNPFGLLDVVGNVYEWCRDPQGSYEIETVGPDAERRVTNPTRVVRGGSYVTPASGARSAKRDSGFPQLENEAIGIRPARAVEP